MKLAEWLSRNGVSRVEFARRIGVTPGAITQLCNSDQAWLSRDTAEVIARETRGAVTPNDFLPASAKEALMPNSVTGDKWGRAQPGPSRPERLPGLAQGCSLARA